MYQSLVSLVAPLDSFLYISPSSLFAQLDSVLYISLSPIFSTAQLHSAVHISVSLSLQVLNLTQSYVSLRVPLYVSYVFHSPAARAGWQNYNLQTQLQLTFVYDTAILWQDGISTPEGSQQQGNALGIFDNK